MIVADDEEDLLRMAWRHQLIDAALRDRLRRGLADGHAAAGLLHRAGVAKRAIRELVAIQRRRSVPAKIGAYRIEDELGRGATGIVYLARRRDGGRVAIKVLAPHLLGNSRRLGRFLREIRMVHAVSHPDLVRCEETGQIAGRPYLVMELLTGGDLEHRAATLERRTAIAAIAAAARGAQAISDAGWVHRDIKPSNILLDATGKAKLADFGLAKVLAGDEQDLTMLGQVVGTPAYLAPEVLTGVAADARSDVYALGASLFHVISGHRPHAGLSLIDTLRTALRDGPPELPMGTQPDLRLVIGTAMARDPAARYATPGAFAADCRRLLAGEAVLGADGCGRRWRWRDCLGAPAALARRLGRSLLHRPRTRRPGRAAPDRRERNLQSITTSTTLPGMRPSPPSSRSMRV